MKTNQLTKNSSNAEIKMYFQKVLQLSQLEQEFPIDLDEVWMLVYSAKNKAVQSLKKDFIENIDYQTINQKVERQIIHKYYLSVSCLEYFIARKIRPVFEVYRQVFHNVASGIEIEDKRNRKSERITAESMQRNLWMMHEQLFANMDNMGMLFNPVFLQVNSFVWDETRSVRANIREFINNYYHLALGSARLLKEKTIRENELKTYVEYFKTESSLNKEKYDNQLYLSNHWKDMFYVLLDEMKRR